MAESKGRILIVDDEANARAALSEILREEGYETETAADGFKALGKIGSFAPDLILTDLKMPGLDGIGLLKESRAASPTTASQRSRRPRARACLLGSSMMLPQTRPTSCTRRSSCSAFGRLPTQHLSW